MKKVLIIAGPSAVGKTTVMTEILSRYPDFELVRSATTREARGDSYDSEYIYCSRAEFESYIANGEMLEYTEYSGNYYGTPASEIERIFGEGKTPFLILDINGVISFKKMKDRFPSFSVYLTAPLPVLEERLYERAQKKGLTEEALLTYRNRVLANKELQDDFGRIATYFDLVIQNELVSQTANEILNNFNK
jgi:guanylate kinase